MAIKIPSRNIYEKDNDKIRDNKIDRIEVGAFEILPNNEYEIPVYNEDIIVENLISFENENKENSSQTRNYGGSSYEDTIDYVYLDNIFKYTEGHIIIPKNRNNEFISKIFKGENEEKKIGFLVNGNTIKKQTSSTVLYTGYDEVGGKHYTKMETIYGEETENKTGVINFPDFPFSISSSSGGILNDNKASITGLQNETEVPISFRSDNLNYYIDYKILVYAKLEYLKGGANSLRGGLNTSPYPYNLAVSGSCDIYEGNEIEITVYGNTIGIDLKDKTVYVPSNSGNKPFSVEGNELMQTSKDNLVQIPFDTSNLEVIDSKNSGRVIVKLKNNIQADNKITGYIKYSYNSYERTNNFVINKGNKESNEMTVLTSIYAKDITIGYATIEVDQLAYAFSKTQAHYAKGKETATIRCSISDYYDEKGEKVIATNNSNKMAFDIYDEVIPYSYGADGNDKPLSRHKDGSPKTFVVLGTRIFYDGAVWQELTLQEK